MWKPPQRIKYIPLVDTWPSREESDQAKLFSPVAIGAVQLQQRTWVPAMVPWRASEDGFVTEDVLDWYGRFARGRPGAIVVEATGIRDVPSGPLLRIGHDRFLPGLKISLKLSVYRYCDVYFRRHTVDNMVQQRLFPVHQQGLGLSQRQRV